jgi:prolyl oligopeptidase
MPIPDPRPTIDAPDDDPHLWLEAIDDEAPLAWVEKQNAITLARFGDPQFVIDRETLAAIFDRPDNIPRVIRRGGLLYNFWRDEHHPRGLWRRTTMDDFRKDAPSWELLIDLDALAMSESEDWVWQGASTLPPLHDRAMLRLSRGGSDACVLREFDLVHKCFVEDGFCLSEAKGGVDWLDADTLLVSSAYGGESVQTRSGYPRTVRLWRRGTDPSQAPVLFEVGRDSVSASAVPDRTAGTERIWFVDRTSFFESDNWIGDRNGGRTKLDLPSDAWIGWDGDWFVLKTRSPWTVADTTYAPDTMIGGSLSALLSGVPRLEILFEGGERVALQLFFWSGGQLILSILDNLSPRYTVLTPSASGWERAPLAGLPQTGVVSAWPLDIEETESNGDLLVITEDPLTPATLSLFARGASPAILKSAPAVFNADGLVVTRHEAASIDGERIPYVQIGPAGGTGDAPVLMSGYGGFDLARQADYNSAVGKLWLERGGTHVVTHIRGGGEFGTRWHEAGRRAGKRLTHDDFAAIAGDLVRRGVTRPKRIAAMGGSNGGILITNMLTRYPERFGALFCTIPLIDMRRYTRLLAGPSWIDEYGDPDKPEDWAFLQTYSAYHAAAPGQTYPPILIATSRRDDRVHPGHARKMAAKLQTLGYEAHFYEPAAGGHSSGKDHREQAAFIALGLGFLRRAIGWAPGSIRSDESGQFGQDSQRRV